MFIEATPLYVLGKCATKMLHCRPDICKVKKCYSYNLAQSVFSFTQIADGSILHFVFVS